VTGTGEREVATKDSSWVSSSGVRTKSESLPMAM